MENLVALTLEHPATARRCLKLRPLLAHAIAGDAAALTVALAAEEQQEREADRAYWQPLRKELERLPHQRTRRTPRTPR